MAKAKRKFKRRGGGRKSSRRTTRRTRQSTVKESEKPVEVEGTITAVLAGTMFRVRLDNTEDHEVLAHISGKMRKRFIRLVIGDRVKLEMSPYDFTKARIVYRL